MNHRNTDLYRRLDPYGACSIVEGFAEEPTSEGEQLIAWQWLADRGLYRQLQGFYGRTIRDLIEGGLIEKPRDW